MPYYRTGFPTFRPPDFGMSPAATLLNYIGIIIIKLLKNLPCYMNTHTHTHIYIYTYIYVYISYGGTADVGTVVKVLR
jgi:hypothetical protein